MTSNPPSTHHLLNHQQITTTNKLHINNPAHILANKRKDNLISINRPFTDNSLQANGILTISLHQCPQVKEVWGIGRVRTKRLINSRASRITWNRPKVR